MKLKGLNILPKQKISQDYTERFYQSYRWRKFRNEYLTINPLCKICDEQGRTTLATALDHIHPIKQGGAVWANYNLQGLCSTCNAKKTAMDNPNNHD